MKKTLLTTVLFAMMAAVSFAAGDVESIYVQKVDFESGQLPEGWTQEFVSSDVYGEHPWAIEPAEGADYPKSVAANGKYFLSLRNNTTATIGYTTRFISPEMDLSQNKVFQPILVFSHAQQQRSGDFDQLKVYYRSKSTDNWVRLDGRNGNPEFNQKITKWQRDTIQLTSQSDTYQVMFEVTDRFGRGVVLDNIEVRPMPTCEDPYGYAVSGLTTTAATVSWNASFDTDSFEVALSSVQLESMEGVNPEELAWYGFLTDDEFAFSTEAVGLKLKRDQTYYIYVRSYCQGFTSDWSSTSFKTKNIANLPLVQNFTAGEDFEYKSGALNHISYWSFGTSIKKDDGVSMEFMPFVNTNTEPGTASAGYYAFDQSFCLAFTGARSLSTDIPAGQFVYAATPELNVPSLSNVFVTFWGTAYQQIGDDYASGIIVGVMTDPEDFTTFVPVDTCYVKTDRTHNKFGVSLAKYTGEGKYVAFASDFQDKKNRFFIDNIAINASNAPVWPSDIKVSNISATGFDLSLNSNGNAYNVVVAKYSVDSKKQVILDPSEFAGDTIVAKLENQTEQKIHISFDAANSGKLLELYAQSVNAAGASDWALPVAIYPPLYLATDQMPYKIDWEETENTHTEKSLNQFGSSGTNTAWPQGIISMTQSAPNGYGLNNSYASISSGTAAQEGKSTSHYLWFRKEYNEVTSGDPEIYGFRHKYGNYIALPQVEDLSKVLLKFYMQRYSSTVENSSRVAVGILTDPYDITTFDTIAIYDCNSPTEYQPFSCVFDGYKGDGKIIAILAMDAENPVSGGSTSSSSYGWKSWYASVQRIDWIQLFPLGECNPIANPVVEASHDTAAISWGANGMSKWQIRIKDAKNVMLVDSMIEQNSFIVRGLMPHSDYTYMVSPECDSLYELSDWLSFTTECVPANPLPFVEDFESADYTTGSSKYFIPFCWSAPLYSYTYSGGGESSTSYYPYITTTYAHNGTRSFCLSSNSSATNQNEVWVALPIMDAPVNALQVEFFVRGYSASQNSMLQVGVMSDPNDISTFVVVDSVNVVGATVWNGAIVKFDKYAGEGKYLAFKRNYERDGKSCSYYIDDITVNYISECEKLFALSTSSPTTNGVTFTWKKTNADKYQVIVMKSKINPNSEDTIGVVVSVEETDQNTLVYVNESLELNTNYYAAVRTICGGVATTWSEVSAFKTTCVAQTPEEIGTIRFDPPNSLGCWSVGVMNGTTAAPSASGSTTGKFGYYLYLFNTAASDGAYAIMPPLDVEDISKYQISFRASTSSTIATNVKRITVGVISNPADLSTFAPVTTLQDLVYVSTTGDTLQTLNYTIPFDSYDGDYVTGAKGTQIMFLSESGDSTNYVCIDNIQVELIPSCAAPSTVVADSVGTYGAKISWNKTGATYELAVTSTKKAPNEAGATIVNEQKNLTDTFAIVEGLEMLTQYYIYVRTICGEGDTSAWSDARTFTTICPESYPLPFAEDFEKSANTGASYKPDCWTYYYLNGTTVTEGKSASYPSISGASYSHSSKYCMYMYSDNATTKKYSFAAMPYIENDLSKAMISFWYKANAYAAATPTRKLVVGIAEEVSTLDTLMATLSVLDTIVQTNTSSTIPYEKYSRIISEKYNGNGHYIVLISVEGNGTTSSGGMYVDDIEVTLVPSCFLPDNLSAAKMYDTSAQLSWEQLQGDNKAWDVAYGLKGAAEADLTIVPADTNVFVINSLQPSTEYDFYVRANCGDETSEWRGPVTATTLYQIPLADAKWTFENGEVQVAQAPTGSYKKPQTWFVNNVWTGLATVGNAPYITSNTKNATTGLITSNKAYSGDSLMYFYSNTTAHPGYGPYAALPVIADADYDSLQVRFMARVTYSGTPSKVDGRDSMMYTTYAYAGGSYKRTIYVGVATDPYDMSTFEEMTQYIFPTLGTSTTNVDINKVPDPEGTNYWREVVVPLYGAKGKYIILAGPGDYNTVFVDNVVVEKVDPNACANVTKLAMDEDALQYNTAEFSWLSPKKSFKVTITESGKTEAYATATVDTAYFKIDTLQAQTTYTIAVQAVCGEDLSKAVTLTFTTPCKPADEEGAKWNFADNLYQWGTSATYVIPECWDEGLGFGSGASYTPYVISNSTTYGYARGEEVTDRSLRFYTTASYYNAYAVLPELGFELDSMKLHFWGRAAYFYWRNYSTPANKSKLYSANGNYARALVIGVMTDPADFETFTPIDTITYDQKWTATAGVFAYDDPTGNEYWQEYALPLAKYAGKGRIAIVAPNPKDFSTASSPTSYFFVDDLEVIKGDFCLPVTGQRAEDVQSTSAVIRWSELSENPYVQLQVATDEDFEKLVYDQQLDSVSAVTLVNLKPATEYYFRLKHLCDTTAGEESLWGSVGSFSTDYVVRFYENFNAVKTNLPKNWWRSNTATAEDVFAGTSQLSEASETATYDWRTSIGSNQYIYANTTTNNASSSSSSAKHWLISPEIDLSANAADSLLLSFDIALRAQSSDIPNPNTDALEQFIVVISTDGGKTWKAEDATKWSTDIEGEYNFNNFYANGKFLSKYVDITKYAGQTIRVAFYIYSFADKQVPGSKNFVCLDNIQINNYTLVENSDKICRWEDYSDNGFELDANQLPAGINHFERFTPSKADTVKDLIERLVVEVEDETINKLDDIVLCEGETYNSNNFNFIALESTVFKQKLQSVLGCDSTVILNVTVNPKQYTDIEETICQGSYYEFNGEKYYTSTNKTATFTSITGCDSIVTLHLTVNEILKGEAEEVFLCPGQTYAFTEKYPALSAEGEYVDTVINARGCDSIATVKIVSVQEGFTFIRVAICQGEIYDEGIFGGLRTAGDYSTPHGESGLKTVYGCDSIVTLHLLVAEPDAETQTFVIEDTISSQNLPYVLNGVELLAAGNERGVYVREIELGCGKATVIINVDQADGVNDIYANSLALEPSVVNVGQSVRVLGKFTNPKVEVIAATGAVAYQQQYTTGQIVVPGIPAAGIYLVRLTDATGVYHAKLVVK